MANQIIGQQGEDRAAKFLERQGFEIILRNYRCRFGEMDLLAWDGKTLVAIEVKARTSAKFGLPAEAIGQKKLARMRRVAENLRLASNIQAPMRLGVVTILGEGEPELILEIETID